MVNFQPKIASAALLKKFYGSDIEETGFVVLENAMELYNDLNYIKKIKTLQKEMKKVSPDSDQFAKDAELLVAYKKNIQNEELLASVAEVADERDVVQS